ncbi:MAG: VWA domain-containing protein [Anaerolineales bacterium]|nr:VWA domain-containing protein [Anaerolineales bacterium]
MVEPGGEEFCLFYNNGDTTADQANRGADHTADYWAAYVDDMGFPAPEYSGVAVKFHVRLLDAGAGTDDVDDCNGSVSPGTAYMRVFDECDADPTVQPQMYQLVFGHELYHQVQLSDGGNDPTSNNFDALWFHEGTARSMEDKVFANVDHWATALAAPISYNGEVNDYLADTNNDVTSDGMRYESALWWTYYSEQCGTNMDETRRGVDAFGVLWDAALTADNLAALNSALSTLGCPSFNTMFRQFAVANWTKDLSGVPDASYNYDDEDEAGNPAPYGPLVPASGGTINSGTAATFNGQAVTRYGARYYEVTPSASDCPVITVNFQRTAGSTEFYHIVTQNGAAFNTHVTGSGASWTQSFLNDGVTQVTAVLGAQGNSATADIEFSCTTPVLNIDLPNQLAPAYVGSATGPDDIVIQVSVTNGSPTGPVVGGLSNTDFQVEVGGVPALVLGGGFVQEDYFLLVNTPMQPANGPYDLEVFLEEPGTTTIIASDTEMDAVVYDNTNTDHVIISDVSGSMGANAKLFSAQNAANLFIDASNSSEGLGLVSYNHDVVNTLGIQFATLPHRNAAHTQVNNYAAAGATSIGDGLNEAVTLLSGSPTGNARCQFTLLSDGMENSSLFWADVEMDVIDTGCPVMTIAFGQASNETLMEEIATDTGGVAYFNDVFVSSQAGAGGSLAETDLDLGNTYLYALCESQGCERILSEKGVFVGLEVFTHTVPVDASLSQTTFVLDWSRLVQGPNLQDEEPAGCTTDLDLQLLSPSGVAYDPGQYAFANYNSEHVGYEVDNPETGDWQMIVSGANGNYFCGGGYQVMAYGQTDSIVELLLPAVQGETGDYVPLYAIWQPGGSISATITAPDGTATTMPLYDDGQHGDGAAGDGFFAGLYTLVTQAVEVAPADEGVPNPPPPLDQGAYRVNLLATGNGIRREAQGSFSVLEGADNNNDGVPDGFVDTHCPGAPTSDADLDQLDCADEYFVGTDPNNSDTDAGGESDESEATLHNQDPLTAADDEIAAPEFVQPRAQNGSVLLSYDVKSEYASMLSYRATNPTGPWTLISASLPLSGVYTDTTVLNDTTYYYCVQAIDGANHWSAVVCSEDVTPRQDPVPPEAFVQINDGASSTTDVDVVLTFIPNTEVLVSSVGGQAAFDDITEVLISNDPSFAGAAWRPFMQGIPWQLEPGVGLRTVYVRFRDVNGNESIGTETASIYLEGNMLFLPLIIGP